MAENGKHFPGERQLPPEREWRYLFRDIRRTLVQESGKEISVPWT